MKPPVAARAFAATAPRSTCAASARAAHSCCSTVAAVINYIMREDYRGTEFRFRTAQPEERGGSSVEGTLTYGQGLNNNKGSFLTTFDYTYRDAIYLRDRGFSKNA